jgi:D-glycero-D-manno-heptose 1,7-bisphosphate phosphatase
MMRAVFLDRDGTIVVGTPVHERVDSVDKVRLLPGTLDGLKLLATLDYGVFLVTNQAGIAEGLIAKREFETINNKVLQLIAPSGIKIIKTYVCPHGERSNCDCRKPKPKMLLNAAKEYDIDLKNSWMIGDRPTDVQAGVNAGTQTILVRTGIPDVESDQAMCTADTLLAAVEYIQLEDKIQI